MGRIVVGAEGSAGSTRALTIGQAREAGVELEGHLADGPAAPALIEAAQGAELLVVGSRGLVGFGGLLLGSVSRQRAHHAPCPLVIVPPPAEKPR